VSERYSRQERFSGLGPLGQQRLRSAEVAIVGVGALGSVLAEMMARAGVGRLTLVDRDYVEGSNLHRQSLFTEEDAERGLPKAVAAAARLRAINSEVEVRPVVADFAAEGATGPLGAPSLVLDGTDNFEARFLLNDVCLRAGIPWVYGACVGAHGLALLVRPGVSPCLRCVLGEKPQPGSLPTCDTAGIVSPIVHVIAGIQGAEALKLLAARSESFLPGLVTVDLWSGAFDVMDLRGRAPWCPACTEARYDYADAPAASAAVLCGRDAVQLRSEGATIDLASLAGRLRAAGEVTANDYLVRFRASGRELVVFGDGRAIVKGVRDAAEARGVYARYVGN
jgi:molybdopterin/thiamine biosynthesis adenylyltransferase